MAVFFTALALALIAALQAPPLVRRREWPELAGFGVMWILASAYAVTIAAGVTIQSPTEITGRLLELIYRLFGLEIILTI